MMHRRAVHPSHGPHSDAGYGNVHKAIYGPPIQREQLHNGGHVGLGAVDPDFIHIYSTIPGEQNTRLQRKTRAYTTRCKWCRGI